MRGIMRKLCVLSAISVLTICAIAVKATERNENLIINPSFETADGENPAGWRTGSWGGSGDFAYASVGRTGDRSVMISSTSGAE